jgi:hypothetical protein
MATKNNLQDWDKLFKAQQQGLLDAIDKLDAGGGEDSEDVLKEMRARYKL